MDIKKEAVREYLIDGIPYRALAKKYVVSRSSINKLVLIHQGIHNLPRSHKQVSYDLQQKNLGKKSKQIIRQDQSWTRVLAKIKTGQSRIIPVCPVKSG